MPVTTAISGIRLILTRALCTQQKVSKPLISEIPLNSERHEIGVVKKVSITSRHNTAVVQ